MKSTINPYDHIASQIKVFTQATIQNSQATAKNSLTATMNSLAAIQNVQAIAKNSLARYQEDT